MLLNKAYYKEMPYKLHILHCIGRRTECMDGMGGSLSKEWLTLGYSFICVHSCNSWQKSSAAGGFCNFFPKFYKIVSEKTIYFYTGMKKLLVFILAVFYLGTSMGATVNLHYCMGRLIDWDFSHNVKRTCDNCGMKKVKKHGCCQDKYKVLQVEKDQKAESTYHPGAPVAIAVTTIFPSFSVPVPASLTEAWPVSNSPPRSAIPARIRYCIFRI
jgi:hypothetical protein